MSGFQWYQECGKLGLAPQNDHKQFISKVATIFDVCKELICDIRVSTQSLQ